MPGSGEITIDPVSVCHHVSTMGQRLPPMCSRYHIHASGLIGSPTEPSRRRRERSCFSGQCVAPLHERADGGRRGVEDRHAEPLADLPEAILLRPVGRALVHHARRAVRERAVHEIRVARDPADVGGAPEDVVLLEVEHDARRRRRADEVARRRVDDPLRLARRARGVEDEEDVLGVHRLGLAPHAGGAHQAVPPVVAPFLHLGERLAARRAGPALHDDRRARSTASPRAPCRRCA